MALLHLSKVAFSCASVDTLSRRQQARLADGIVPLVTRFMPKRADELIGGSLYWIVKHRLIARNRILGFAVRPRDGRTIIQLDPELVRVRQEPKRGAKLAEPIVMTMANHLTTVLDAGPKQVQALGD